MKKIFALIICVILATGCGTSKEVSSSATQANGKTPVSKDDKKAEVSEELLKEALDEFEVEVAGISYTYYEEFDEPSKVNREFNGKLKNIEILKISDIPDTEKTQIDVTANIENDFYKLEERHDASIICFVANDQINISKITITDEEPLFALPVIPFDIEYFLDKSYTIKYYALDRSYPTERETIELKKDDVDSIEVYGYIWKDPFEMAPHIKIVLKDGVTLINEHIPVHYFKNEKRKIPADSWSFDQEGLGTFKEIENG